MGRLTVQLGAAIVVPIVSPRRLSMAWRRRACGEAAAAFAAGTDVAEYVAAAAVACLRSMTRSPKRPHRGRARTAGPAASCAAMALLAGCASIIPVPTTVETSGMPNPEAALLQSMHHVDAEMAQLGEMGPSTTELVQSAVPEDLRRTVSFSWKGPLDDGVAKLAQSIGYTFYTTGPASQQPIDVAIEISTLPVYRVFQALGDEAGAQATVQVDPQHHQVQVIHHV